MAPPNVGAKASNNRFRQRGKKSAAAVMENTDEHEGELDSPAVKKAKSNNGGKDNKGKSDKDVDNE